MKASKLLVGLSLCGTVLSAGAGVVYGDDGGSVKTDGTIDFKTKDNDPGIIIKPETPNEEIIIDEGGKTTGPLRIQFVPDFNFGNIDLETGLQTANPTYVKHTFKDQTAPEKQGDKYLPHFVQVTDARGTNEGFKLTVKSTIFQRQTKTTDKLENSSITLKDGRLSNTVYDDTTIKGLMTTFKGIGNEGTGELIIPTGANAALEVMNTQTGKTTNGTQTSLVLDSTYDKTKTDYLATDKNMDVVFTKPNEDIATVLPNGTNDPYVAKIEWTLVSAL